MKKIYLIFTFLLCTQISQAQKLKFGIAGGLNMAEVKFDEGQQVDIESTLKTAFNGGIYAQISLLKDKIILQPEIMYSAEGFVSKIDDTDNMSSDEKEVETNLNFLSVPVTVIIKPTKFFNIQLGPEFGYLLKAVAKGDVDKTTVTDFYNRPELGLNLGLGITIGGLVNVNLRYNKGLTKLFDGNTSELEGEENPNMSELPEGTTEILNNMFQISVGLNISQLLGGGE